MKKYINPSTTPLRHYRRELKKRGIKRIDASSYAKLEHSSHGFHAMFMQVAGLPCAQRFNLKLDPDSPITDHRQHLQLLDAAILAAKELRAAVKRDAVRRKAVV